MSRSERPDVDVQGVGRDSEIMEGDEGREGGTEGINKFPYDINYACVPLWP